MAEDAGNIANQVVNLLNGIKPEIKPELKEQTLIEVKKNIDDLKAIVKSGIEDSKNQIKVDQAKNTVPHYATAITAYFKYLIGELQNTGKSTDDMKFIAQSLLTGIDKAIN